MLFFFDSFLSSKWTFGHNLNLRNRSIDQRLDDLLLGRDARAVVSMQRGVGFFGGGISQPFEAVEKMNVGIVNS